MPKPKNLWDYLANITFLKHCMPKRKYPKRKAPCYLGLKAARHVINRSRVAHRLIHDPMG